MKQRIVFLCPGLTEPGGTARRSRLIAEGLVREGWEIRMLTRSGILRRPRIERQRGLTVLELPGFGKRRIGAVLFYLLAPPIAMVWGVRARCFLALQLFSTSTVAAICALLLRKPFLAMASTSGALSETRYLSSQRTGRVRRWLLAKASWLVAQTPQVARELEELIDAQRIAVLPNPVILPAVVEPLTGDPRVLFAGRLSVEKDLFVLLQAWRSVLKRCPGARLTIAGKGGAFRSVESELRAEVTEDKKLTDSVGLAGWVSVIDPLLDEHDVFVLPSREEGMSNALLEACAAGRLPVASRIVANVAILGADHPFLFEPGDHAALAERLGDALTSSEAERHEVRARLRDRLEREFSAEAVIGRLGGLIRAADRTRH